MFAVHIQVELQHALWACKHSFVDSLQKLEHAYHEAKKAGLAECEKLYKFGKELLARATVESHPRHRSLTRFP